MSNSPLSLLLHRITVVLPSSLQLGPSVSLWPSLPLAHKARCDAVPLSRVEVWQHRGSGCASRALGPRGGDCGKILMPPPTTTTVTMVLNRRRPAREASSRDFLLSRSRSLGETSRRSVSLGRRQKILRRPTRRRSPRFIIRSRACHRAKNRPHPRDVRDS